VLVLIPDGAHKLAARWLDVRKQRWAETTLRADAAGAPAMDKLAAYAAPEAPRPAVAPVIIAAKPAEPPPPAKSKWGAWGKWYTWVAAGAVLALVGGLLIAEHVGSDSLNVEVVHKPTTPAATTP
jgi:hypothetical protein